MKIETPADISALRRLWRTAFGDSDAFLDGFFRTGFAPDRSLCLTENGVLAAALYWFDCQYAEQKMAYVYAVATDPVYRGRGCCRLLMEALRQRLQAENYAAALLVPASEGLRRMYAGMGYTPCTRIREFTCTAAGEAIPLREVSPAEYAAARKALLPSGSVVQEDICLDFLQTFNRLYVGENVALVVQTAEKETRIVELLGDGALAPQILRSLGLKRCNICIPGSEKPFAMALPLGEDTQLPTYFGLAFD